MAAGAAFALACFAVPLSFAAGAGGSGSGSAPHLHGGDGHSPACSMSARRMNDGSRPGGTSNSPPGSTCPTPGSWNVVACVPVYLSLTGSLN